METALAAVTRSPKLPAEAADLLYHLLVLLEASEIDWMDVLKVLRRRSLERKKQMNMDYENKFGAFFNQAADGARAIALKYFPAKHSRRRQGRYVAGDRSRSAEIERSLRAMIRATFPDHGIIGEEYGKENEGAEFVWVIDPIDGTKSFATSRPSVRHHFWAAICTGAYRSPGLIEQAYTKERWFGIAGAISDT